MQESDKNGIVEQDTIDEWNSGMSFKKQRKKIEKREAKSLPRKVANSTFDLEALPRPFP